MIINTKQIITMTEANQNFSKAAKISDEYKEAIIIKNNKPKYLLIDIENHPEVQENLELTLVASKILKKYLKAFENLAE